jgi:drug/metabolite transporter (DMT)-like permease
MSQTLIGCVLALATGFLWAVGPMCFASIGRRIGAFSVLLLGRLGGTVALALVLLVYAPLVSSGMEMPSGQQWLWIFISSLLGMVLGDALLYEAFVSIGPRRATQVLMLSPIFSVAVAWLFMGEVLDVTELAGIAVVLAAVAIAVTTRSKATTGGTEPGILGVAGVLNALGAAALIGVSAVAARHAFLIAPLDPILASFLRVAMAAGMLWLIPLSRGTTLKLLSHLKDQWILQRLIPGILAGPAIGIICYVTALKLIEAGVVSTLSQTSPLFMMPMIWYRYRARIGLRAALATIAALVGIAMIIWPYSPPPAIPSAAPAQESRGYGR